MEVEGLLRRIETLEMIVIAFSKILEACAVGQPQTLEEQIRSAIQEAKTFKPEPDFWAKINVKN